MRNNDLPTRFFELTHRGRGAIAAIGILGCGSERILEQCFTPVSGRALNTIRRNIIYGTWNSTGEDLIVHRIGEKEFEVHCHGGVAAVESIKHSLRQLESEEVDQLCQWQAARNVSWWQAAIEEKLSQCKTDRTAKVLLQQLNGWEKVWREFLDGCENGSQEEQKRLALRVASFLKWRELGEHLTIPWTVVLCGKPNAGKSSLINAIVGFERAIVHETQGTTRDILSQYTAIDGWPIEIKDTAGLRRSEQVIESLGIEKALAEIEHADLVVFVCDATEFAEEIENISIQLRNLTPKILVINKTDLVDANGIEAPELGMEIVHTAATKNTGIDDLLKTISMSVVPNLPGESELVPVTDEQLAVMEELAKCLGNDQTEAAIKLLKSALN
jgi:tRNA modification GTPase